jgi:hypothetical protein
MANTRSWQSGEAIRRTDNEHKGPAQYNPYLHHTDDQVRSLETRCLEHGTLLAEFDDQRHYYLSMGKAIVGACCGQTTSYVFVEWHDDGDYHGRPMSVGELRRRGAKI